MILLRNSSLLFAAVLTAMPFINGGCSSAAIRSPEFAARRFTVSEKNKISSVAITLTPGAKEELKDNLKFDQEQLRQTVERAFSGYGVLDKLGATHLASIEIVVTDIRVRSNFSAVMWGFMAGADKIDGDIVVRDPSGNERDRFKVSTSYALGGFAGGQDSARMDWLYEAFAKETIKEVTGTPTANALGANP